MASFLSDLRYALRSILGNPLASFVLVLSLAVGIGINTTSFSILNAMALRDLPGVTDQDRLVTFAVSFGEAGERVERGRFAWTDLEVLRDRTDLFSGVAAGGPTVMAVEGGSATDLLVGEVVSPEYFRVLGARPALGTFFSARGEDRLGPRSVAVVSHHFWRHRLGEDPGVVGRTLRVNGHPVEIVGVAEEGFTGMSPDDVIDGEQMAQALWLPASMAPSVHPPGLGSDPLGVEARWFRPFARLAPGVTEEALLSALPALAGSLERAHPRSRRRAAIVHGDLIFGPGAGKWRPTLTVIAFMVVPLIVLLVACANAANLLLARGASRRRELAVRKALGASRAALVRQLLVESTLLAGGAGVAGLVVALWARQVAGLFALRLSMEVPLDWRVFTFALLVSLGTGILFGLLPALRAASAEVKEGLGGMTHGSRRHDDSRLRDGLVVVQVALGLLLLVSSGLFVRSARHGLTIDSGFREERLLLLSLDLDILGYEASEGRAFYRDLQEALRGAAGVEAAGLASGPPLQGYPGLRVAPAEADVAYGSPLSVTRVGDGFLDAAGVDLLSGRPLRESDMGGTTQVALLNEAAARRLGGPGEALGRALRIDGEEEIVDVVGIVADTRPSLYSRPEPVVYLPRNATYRPRATLYVRTSGDPAALIPTVRTLVRTLDPRLPLLSLEAAADLRHRLLAPWRLGYLAMGVLGSIAVLLAGAGLYGVLAYSVARRTREIGIRLAIGASRGAVVRMIVGRSLRVVALGLVAGFPLAAILAFLLRRMLFGVSPMDPWVYGEVGGLLLAVAVLAALLPARRAASVEPVRAMTE